MKSKVLTKVPDFGIELAKLLWPAVHLSWPHKQGKLLITTC